MKRLKPSIQSRRKILFLLFICLFFGSCHTPSYLFTLDSTPYGIDFRQGNWLINIIDAPDSVKPELEEMAWEGFSNHLGKNLHHVRNTHDIIIPGNLTINPSKEVLQNLKIGTGFDYFINIKTNVVSNELGGMQIGKIRDAKKNQGEVILEIYDLNNSEIIYTQHVVGILKAENDNKDFALAKSADKMLVGGFKRIMKKIEKTQI